MLTNLEKKLIMKDLGIKILKRLPYRTDLDLVGVYNGFFIYPYNYYWIVEGKMPLKYANELFEKYKSLKIRVDGGSEENIPEEYKTCDEYIDFKNNYTESHYLLSDTAKHLKIMTDKREEIFNENPEALYIETYHIDTLDGLKVFVNTIKENNIITDWNL